MPQKKTREFINLSIDGYLEISNAYTFPTIDGIAGYTLTTDGLGNVTWQTPVVPSLSNVLLIGNTTSGTNIEMTSGDTIVSSLSGTGIAELDLSFFGFSNNAVLSATGDPTTGGYINVYETGTILGHKSVNYIIIDETDGVTLHADLDSITAHVNIDTNNFRITNGGNTMDLVVDALSANHEQTFQNATGIIALTTNYTLENVLINGDFTGINDMVISTQSGTRIIRSDNATSSNQVGLQFSAGGTGQDSLILGDPTYTLGGSLQLYETEASYCVYTSASQCANLSISTSDQTFKFKSTAGTYGVEFFNNINVKMQSPNGTSNWATFKPTNLTANRSYTFQNKNGTVAFLSDITASGLSGVLAIGNTTSGNDIEVTYGDNIHLRSSDGFNHTLTMPIAATGGNKTVSFQTGGGTLAYLSDLPSVSDLSNVLSNGNFTGANDMVMSTQLSTRIIRSDNATTNNRMALSFLDGGFNKDTITIGDQLLTGGGALSIGNDDATLQYYTGLNAGLQLQISSSGFDFQTYGGASPGNVVLNTSIGLEMRFAGGSGVLRSASGLSSETWDLPAESGILPIGPGWNTLIANPTVTQDTYVISWDNVAGEYTLTPAGVGTVTSIDVSGGTTGLTTSGGPVTTSGTITLAGTLAEANGGTNQTTYAVGDILYSAGIGSLSRLPAGLDATVLTLSGGVPTWTTPITGGIYGGSGPLSSSTVVTMAANNLTFNTTSGDILFTNATGPNPLLLIDGTSGSIGIGGSVTLTESLSVYNQTGSGNDTALGIHNDNTSGTQKGIFIQTNGASVTNIALQLEADTAGNNYALIVPKDKGDSGFGTITPDATVDIVGTLQYVDGSQGAGKVLTSDGTGNATWTTQTTAKKTWTWGASRNSANTTLSYIRTFDGVPTNLSPYIAAFNCNITDISCSTSVNETWTAEVHVNGIVSGSISVTAASNDISTGLSIAVLAGDLISFYCNGTNISHPHIEAWFIET